MPKRAKSPQKSIKAASKGAGAGKRSMADAAAEGSGVTAKAFAVIEAIVRGPRPPSIPEIVASCGLKTATTHRIIKMLSEMGLIQRDVDRRYSEGARLLELAMSTLSAAAQRSQRHVLMSGLAADVGEICHFCVQDGSDAVAVDVADVRNTLGIRIEKGMRLPLNATAPGKVLLAFLNATAREEILAVLPMEARARQTITDREQLKLEIEKIARDAYALADGEAFEGIIGIAVPVHTSNGRLIGALAVTAPQARRTAAELLGMLPRIIEAASKLGATY